MATFNWQQPGWPNFMFDSGALKEKLASLEAGLQRASLAKRVGKSVEAVKRALTALVKAGKVEHRGGKKTGGYFVVDGR